tara:strand:- start:1076 stop:1516 length:441 start_codon:yes stop_codon:yes gene_type:complete
MGVTLTQYENMVTLDSKGFINILVIEYSGKMQIELDVEVKKVKMTDKRIIIYFNRGTQINDALFHYSGWIDIKKAICYTSSGKYRANKILKDSTWGRLGNNWDEINNTWEYYDAHISSNNEKRRSISYPYKGIKIKRTPKIRGLRR